MKKRSLLIILCHLIYWLPTLVIFIVYLFSTYTGITQSVILLNESIYVVGFVAFYIAYFLLFPFISEKKFGAFIGGSVLTVIVSCGLGLLFLYGIKDFHEIKKSVGLPQLYSNYPFKAVSSIFIACVIRGFIGWYTDLRYKQQLEKKNLEAQLALLKAQINPHFLFNTLNNIDMLIEKDPQKASAYLQKLSGILRFMLYENTDEKIVLSKEVAYIREYIELQKIRTATPGFIHFDVKGNTDKALIAPMLFIPFIENAFKHSTNKKIDKGIDVLIAADDNGIKFTCVNVYDEAAVKTQEHSGLGLDLIRNRLDLLYKNNYHLYIDKTSNRFSVTLSINI